METLSHFLFRTFLLCIAFLPFSPVFAQRTINIDKNTSEHIFNKDEVVCVKDENGEFTIDQVSNPSFDHRFKATNQYYHKNTDRSATYWYKIKINFKEDLSHTALFEFFDQTTDHVEAYIQNEKGHYVKQTTGAAKVFYERVFEHKNFEFLIESAGKGEHYYYFKIKSDQQVNVIIVYRTVTRFIYYILREYFSYGLFYGMILIFSLHNLLMLIAVKRKQYLYYILYILSVGLYEMSTDGIAFQFLWPNHPILNEYAHGIALYFLSVFALVFTKELLHVKDRAIRLNKIINCMLLIRTLFFLVCLFYSHDLFRYKFIEFLPLSLAFFTGVWIWVKQKFRPARFFVLGYFFLFVGFIIKVIYVLGFARFLPGAFGHYSLGFAFILEMILLSFAIGDQVRILKKKKEDAQKQIIKQMKVTADLSETINKELETKVQQRTKEVLEKSNELLQKAIIIENQNEVLTAQNVLLEQHAAEINRMNGLLERDNKTLKFNIEKVTEDRVQAKDMDFEEFSMKYPDKDACYKFLSEMKWANGYECIKCKNTSYCNGRSPYNRRCTKCAYEESVLHKTVFENNRIPINKAFYLVYLMYYHKGAISSYKLSEKLGIRQSTCWTYAVRMKKVMDERKKVLKGSGTSGWSKLVLEEN
jgi:hypothetical protein